MTLDPSIEKNIITGMIISKEFLQEVQPIFRPLRSSFANIIAEWCNTYFQKYKKAPEKHIQDIYNTHSEQMDEDNKELTCDFLDHISSEYIKAKTFNIKYVLDNAEKYFRTLALEEIKSKLILNLKSGKIDNAENLIKEFERVVRPETKGVNPFDSIAIKKAFNEGSGDKMFSFPGTLGKVVGTFEREHLVAFVGNLGIGKTWWLMWTALLGVFEGYNVVFVSLEMSESQMIKRIHQHINALPVHGKKRKISIPIFDEDFEIEYKKVKKTVLCDITSIKKINAILKSGIINKNSNFRMLVYPSRTVSVSTLELQLQNMEYYDNFIPDVIVTDYADKFLSENKSYERRHQLTQIWEAHKSLAQKRKCLVITASQSNTVRTGKDIKQGDWSESISKIELCDIGLSLNQKPEQKKDGYMRVKVLKQRHNSFDLLKEVTVLQSLEIGRCYLDSAIIGGH